MEEVPQETTGNEHADDDLSNDKDTKGGNVQQVKQKKCNKTKLHNTIKKAEIKKPDAPSIRDILDEGKDFQGQGNMPGRNFQSKILAWYMCRGRDLKDFRLATEVKSAGKFDDLVFSYKNGAGQSNYCLLQAKQILKRDSMTNAIRKITPNDLQNDPSFSLLEYFESYLKIIRENEGSFIEHLILFTNIDFDFSKIENADCPTEDLEDYESKIMVRKAGGQEGSLIPPNSYQFLSLPRKLRGELVKKDVTRENRLAEFLDKLVYAVDQPDYNALDDIIKEELNIQFNLLQSDDMFNEMLGKVWNAYSQSRGKAIEGKIEQRDFISTMFLSGVRFKSHPEGVDWVDYFITTDPWEAILEDESNSLICIYSPTPALTSIKVAQALRQVYAERQHPEQYFAIVDDHILVSQKERSEYTFSYRKEFVLVVMWHRQKVLPTPLAAMRSRLVDIAQTCKTCPDTAKTEKKRLVFIWESQSDFCPCDDDSENWATFEDRCEFADISEEAVARFMDGKALLQGEVVQWSEILSLDAIKRLETNVRLINGSLVHEQLAIGKPIRGLEGMKSSYIGRTFEWLLTSSKDCLEHIPSSQIFVFGPEDRKHLKNFPGGKNVKKFLGTKESVTGNALMLRDDSDFSVIWDLFPEKNVYWLDVIEDRLRLKKKADNVLLDETELAGNGVKVNIIIGEPGMGKSVVLTKIASMVKRRAALWVIRINLLDASDVLNEMKDKAELEIGDVYRLVFEEDKLMEPYEQELFSYYFTQTDKTCFFIDGFDDICPHYEDVVIHLLNLLDSTDSRVWVTSRPHYRKKLGSELSCCPYSLSPFSLADQKTMLVSLYAEPGSQMAAAFTEKIMDEFAHPSFRFVSQCLKIPLLTRIIGEVYLRDFEKFCTLPETRTIQRVGNILELYNKVIQKKYEYYMQEKEHGDMKNPHVQSRIKELCRQFTDIHVHQQMAVKLLFPVDLKSFMDKTLVSNSEGVDQMLNVGIVVDNSDDRSKLSFVHRTFAEYFVAKVLADVVLIDKYNWFARRPGLRCMNVIKFWKARYFDENHQTLRIFFDGLLAESSSMMMAILNDDVQKVRELVEANPGCVAQCDKLDRSVMHLAAAYSRCHDHEANDDLSMLHFLWKYRKRIQFCKKDRMDFNVLSYAMGSIMKGPESNTLDYLTKKFREEVGENNLNKML